MVELTRRSVAREEIQTAIDLVLTGGSLATAHLIAWAAVDVLRGVAKKEGVVTLHDQIEEFIVPEKVMEWRKALRDEYTFSKHSDKDPDRVVEDFSPDSAYLTLFAAVLDYGAVYKQITLEMSLFQGWVLAKWPDLLGNGAAAILFPNADAIFGPEADLDKVSGLYRELNQLPDKADYIAMYDFIEES